MTTAGREEPEPIREARQRIGQIDRMLSEAREAIEQARTDIELNKSRREVARARGDHAALWQIDQAILDAEAAIAARELQIRRLHPERETLPAVLVEYDRRRHEADRLREEDEGYRRLAELNAEYKALAAKCEEYRLWASDHPGAPGVHEYPWLESVRRTGTGHDFDWHLQLTVRCAPERRHHLAQLERSLAS